jgi:hypothetical protein
MSLTGEIGNLVDRQASVFTAERRERETVRLVTGALSAGEATSHRMNRLRRRP